MLSRVAHTLYWMVRLVERADNLARLIDVNQQILLDTERLDSTRLSGHWLPIVLSSGDDQLFHSLYEKCGSNEVIHFLTDDERNPNSIVACIAQARENARTVRDRLPEELWEELNSLYLFCRSPEARRLIVRDPHRFYNNIHRATMTFQGVSASTIPRDEGRDFMDLGRNLERADKTTRFLDVVTYQHDAASGPASDSPLWTAILRSCGALGAFRACERESNASTVTGFLVYASLFPRSVRHCIDRADAALHRISGSPRGTFSNDAEREAGRLLAELNFGSTDDIFATGLHQYLDTLQARFNAIGEAVFHTYVLMPGQILACPPAESTSLSARAEWEIRQQQQQQQ